MDGHFAGYNHEIAVVRLKNGKEKWLPLIEKDGRPGSYLLGRMWVHFTFRVMSPNVNNVNLAKGLERLTWFWCKKNGSRLDGSYYIVKMRKLTVPFEWEKDITEKQAASPWQDIGSIRWQGNDCIIELPEIESL